MKFYKSCILLLSLILGLASANVIPDVKPALKGVTILVRRIFCYDFKKL